MVATEGLYWFYSRKEIHDWHEFGRWTRSCDEWRSKKIKGNASSIIDTQKLQKVVIENKKNHGFNTTDVKFELLLLYGEVNELFQAWLKDDHDNINEELADVAIFLLGISEMLGSDLGEDIVKKLKINAKRKYTDGKKIEG